MAKAPRSLTGKVVAITGGARGIGRATAVALVSQGARVAVGDIDEELVQRTAQDLGGGTIGLRVDVTSRPSFEAFLNEVETRLGPLDVLINNAGIMPVGPFAEESDATAKRMIDINLHGVIFGSKLALGRFLPRGSGHLVNIASIAGKGGAANGATYSATKHAVVGLCDALRQELKGSGVGITVVMPVGVNTELYSGVKQIRGIKTPEPEDVARAIVDALQYNHYAVFVPKVMDPLVRSAALLPTRLADMVNHFLRVDQALGSPDKAARAAYDARLAQTIAQAEEEAPAAEQAPVPGGQA